MYKLQFIGPTHVNGDIQRATHSARITNSDIRPLLVMLLLKTTAHSVQLPSQWHHSHRPTHSIESIVSTVVHVTAKCLDVCYTVMVGRCLQLRLTVIRLQFSRATTTRRPTSRHDRAATLWPEWTNRSACLRLEGQRPKLRHCARNDLQ